MAKRTISDAIRIIIVLFFIYIVIKLLDSFKTVSAIPQHTISNLILSLWILFIGTIILLVLYVLKGVR